MTHVDKTKDMSPRIQRQYEEVAHAFTIEGMPIHPLVLYRFITAWSDYGPDLLSVNLTEALRCNDTYGWEVEPKHNWDPLVPHKTDQFPEEWQRYDRSEAWFADGSDEGYMGYRRLGVLQGDVQIIQFYENGGGSMTAYTVLLVQPRIRTLWDAHFGTWTPRHVVELELIGTYNGLIDDAYTLHEDRITVQPLTDMGGRDYQPIFDPFDIWMK